MEKISTTYMIIPKDLNHHGTLYAGQAMYYLTQAGFICASYYFEPDKVVFRAIHEVNYRYPIQKGALVVFQGQVVHFGKSSITVHVQAVPRGQENPAIDGFLTYVTVGENKKKTPHNLTLDESDDQDELDLRRRAKLFYKNQI